MLSFGNSNSNQNNNPRNLVQTPLPAAEQSDEEKQAAEQKRLFELSMKKAQEDLKTDRRDTFVRSR